MIEAYEKPPSINIIQAYQDETYMAKDTEMFVKVLLDKLLNSVWRTVQKPRGWKRNNPSEWEINIAKKRRAEGDSYITRKRCQSLLIAVSVNLNAMKIFLKTIGTNCAEIIGI